MTAGCHFVIAQKRKLYCPPCLKARWIHDFILATKSPVWIIIYVIYCFSYVVYCPCFECICISWCLSYKLKLGGLLMGIKVASAPVVLIILCKAKLFEKEENLNELWILSTRCFIRWCVYSKSVMSFLFFSGSCGSDWGRTWLDERRERWSHRVVPSGLRGANHRAGAATSHTHTCQSNHNIFNHTE